MIIRRSADAPVRGRPRGSLAVTVPIRLPVDLMERMEAILGRDGGTRNSLVRDALEVYCTEYEAVLANETPPEPDPFAPEPIEEPAALAAETDELDDDVLTLAQALTRIIRKGS